MADPIRMRATKDLTYRTRRLLADGSYETTSRLQPGDVFEVVRARDVRVLRATRKAVELRGPTEIPPPPPAVREKIAAAVEPATPPRPPEPPPASAEGATGNVTSGEGGAPVGAMTTENSGLVASDLAAARAAYREAFGKPPFHGWDAATLRAKIAEKGQP